jgi:hypothetical protein
MAVAIGVLAGNGLTYFVKWGSEPYRNEIQVGATEYDEVLVEVKHYEMVTNPDGSVSFIVPRDVARGLAEMFQQAYVDAGGVPPAPRIPAGRMAPDVVLQDDFEDLYDRNPSTYGQDLFAIMPELNDIQDQLDWLEYQSWRTRYYLLYSSDD